MKGKEFDPKQCYKEEGKTGKHPYDSWVDNMYPEKPSYSFSEDISNRSYTELFSKLEELGHGESLKKFIAVDKAATHGDGDFSVEIHGLVDESNRFYIISEKVTRYKLPELTAEDFLNQIEGIKSEVRDEEVEKES